MKLTFSLIAIFYLPKTENRIKKISKAALTLLLSVKVLFQPKNPYFFQINADISKIKRTLVLKSISSETTYVCTCLPNFKFPA